MNKFIAVVLCFIALFNVSAKQYGDVQCKVVSVYDGDTFFVDIPGWPAIVGKRIGVRVYGINTPEIHSKDEELKRAAQECKEFGTKLLTDSKSVKLKNLRRDKYFRLLADVEFDGKDYARHMLDMNYAVPYFGGTK